MRWLTWSCSANKTIVQLTRGMLGRLSHHCRIICALSGYQGEKWNGLRFGVGGVVVAVVVVG